jgi:hypothetical protein
MAVPGKTEDNVTMPGADEPVIDFSGYVAERTEGFGGRDWILLAIDEWLADPASGPIFLLTGEPGAGKSALAGHLALISNGAVPAPDGAGSLRAGFLGAVHFCSARDLRWITPSVFAKSLARQLSERYASYALALLQDAAPRINVRQEVGQNWGRMVAVEINTLEVNAGHHEDLFDRIVRAPLEALARDQLTAQVTILVDALDESLASRERPTIAELVANAEGLPETVRFVVTCRPRSELIRSLQRRSRRQYTLSPRRADDGGPPDEYALVLRDVQDHVERMLRDQALSGRLAAGLAPAQFVAAIRDKSEGNFLYVRYLLRMMLDRPGSITLESIAAVPTGLDDIYFEYMRRLDPAGPQAWHGEYGKVLGILAVAQAPLSEDQIAAIAVLSPAVIRGALHKLREVLEADEGRPASQREYSLYHRSLADFLLDRDRAEDYWLDDVSQHRLVAEHYLASGTDGWRACDEYGMRYLATHLLGGREIARLQSLLDHDWIRMRYERGHYSYDGVLGDVELAWRAAEQVNRNQIAVGETASYVAQDVRWALVVSSIGSLAAGIPADLLGALVRRGEWSALQGLVYARRVPEGEPRSVTLASLAAHLPEPLRADAFAEAVAAAGQIPDARERAEALTRLLTMLPPEPRTQALIQAMAALRELSDRRRIASGTTGYYGGDIGERYEHTGIRTAVLSELGDVLAGLNGFGQAEIADRIAAACAEDNDRFPAAAAAVAAQLTADPLPSSQPRPADPPADPPPGPSPLADITARIRIGDADERAAFAAAFAAPKKPDPGGELAAEVAAIGRVPSPYYQAARLSELAPRLPADLLPAALTVAENIRDDDARARAMHRLAPRLPEDLLRRVVSAIGPQSRGVSFTLAPVARYLPEPLLREAFTRVGRIESASERAGVMAALADYLPEPLGAEAMGVVRQAARGGRYSSVTNGLARLAMHLPDAVAAEFSGLEFERDNDRVDSFPELLRARRWAASVASWERVTELAARAIAQAENARFGRGYASWNLRYQIKLLIGLLPHLPEPSLAETAAAAAIRLIVDESSEELPSDQVATLGAYLPRALLPEAVSPLIAELPRYLPDELLAAALETARACKSVPWLFALTPRLDPAVLPEALRVARELGGAGLQAQLLGNCAQAFARLPPDLLYAAWCDTLRGMANLNRAEFLRHLGTFGPVAAALGGPDAMAGARQAVDEIGRWWP